MTTYVEVSQALVSAGYLTYDNLDAAAALLAAELIDEGNLEASAVVIADAWDEDEE